MMGVVIAHKTSLNKSLEYPLHTNVAEILIFPVRDKVVLALFARFVAMLKSAFQAYSPALREQPAFRIMNPLFTVETV
jgi:hypothetical protein